MFPASNVATGPCEVDVSRVAILWLSIQQKHGMKEVKASEQALGIQIQSVVASRRLGGIESALSAISQERPDGRNERRRIIRQQTVDAFWTIDVPLPDAPPVRFSLPRPVNHRMRPWRPVRASIARLLKAYPQVRWLIPGRFR